MNALSLFTGIGGLDLAALKAGIEVAAFCEIEPFPVSILHKRFPEVPIFDDVKTLTKKNFMEVLSDRTGMESSQPVDIIFGGFPCQDLSQAGKQVGLTGARSGLWFEMLRVISEFRPRYVLAENVRGAVNLALDTVYSGLVGEGYKVWAYVIPASAVGAPHQRERLFVVGVRKDIDRRYNKIMAYAGCELRQGSEFSRANGVGKENWVADKSERPCGTLWPTPTQRDYKGTSAEEGLIRNDGKSRMDQLPNAVKFWPTPPREFMYKDSTSDRGKGNIGEKVGGQLNPDWVGQLMGYPEGWTDLDVDEPKEWQGWPALLGQEQYPYEFPRTTTGCKDRAKRLKALGNSVVPQQAYPFLQSIAEIERVVREDWNEHQLLRHLCTQRTGQLRRLGMRTS